MIDSDQLVRLFPREGEFPAEHRRLAPIHQRSYLVDGELRPCKGPAQTVRSPICVRGVDGSLEQVEIGSYPQASEAESEEALAAAMQTPQWQALRADAAAMHERFGVTLANGLGTPHQVDLRSAVPYPHITGQRNSGTGREG